MKKFYPFWLLILLFTLSLNSFSQTNTFPSTGNVGIGTLSPSSPLTIVSSTSNFVLYNNTGTNNGYVTYSKSGTAYAFIGSRYHLVSSALSSTDFTIRAENNLSFSIGSSEKVIIKSDGKVGIGISSPTYGFESALTNASLADKTLIIGGGNEIWTQSQTNATADLYINHRGYADGYTQFRNTRIDNGKSGLIAFFDGTNSRVGIGTTSPGYKLSVSGILGIDGTGYYYSYGRTGFANNGNIIANNGTGPNFILAETASGLYGVGNAAIGSVLSNPAVTFDLNNNYLGIGTTPTSKLDVVGTYSSPSLNANSYSLASFRAGGHVQVAINAQLSSPYTISFQGKHTVSNGNSYPIAFQPLGGVVGVGTTEPNVLLDVNGNGRFSYIYFEKSGSTRDSYIGKGRGGSDEGFDFYQADNADMAFYTNATNRMSILANGNVGIGTTNPQNKLDVNGTIRAKEIKATLDGWSDYVFNNDYKLLSLSEVEKFIKKNSRLPDIPSAGEVIKDGVNLGEMNALLLKKIEELTLYVIELNHRLEQIESKKSTNF